MPRARAAAVDRSKQRETLSQVMNRMVGSGERLS